MFLFCKIITNSPFALIMLYRKISTSGLVLKLNIMNKFEDLLGKTLAKISINLEKDEILFITDEGDIYKLYHFTQCCESVYIEDIDGNISDLIGEPLLQAEEVTNSEDPPKTDCESFTWTFYKLATIKGYVTIRWLGLSTGEYSESVEFIKLY